MNVKIGLIGANGKLGKTITKLEKVIEISRSTDRAKIECDVLIDVSSPEALLENLSANKPIVIGTTGHKNLEAIQKGAETLPIFYAPNFSLSIALLKKLSLEIAKYFPENIDLIETHHTEKKDAPSGTALLLAQNLPGTKIQSIRSGNVIGEHTLIFSSPEEKITLSHEALTRDLFAKGALAAAHFLIGKPPGLYTMDNLFE